MTIERALNGGFADLHTHSNVSDCPFTVPELFASAKRLGIRWLSVTDHDTAVGLPACIEAAARYEIGLVPGIEITSAVENGSIVHLLGYGLETESIGRVEEALAPVREGRTEACRQTVKALNERGFRLPWSDVVRCSGGEGVFKYHIMHALISAGYATKIKGSLYRELNAPGGPLSGHKAYVSAALAIGLIHEAGGVAVLAHPAIDRTLDSLDELLGHGLDGIEVYHPSGNTEVIGRALDMAQRHELLVTGGSDYHGYYGEYDVPMGCPDLGRGDLEELLKRIAIRPSTATRSRTSSPGWTASPSA